MVRAECEALFNYITQKDIQQNISNIRNVVYERNLFNSVPILGYVLNIGAKDKRKF